MTRFIQQINNAEEQKILANEKAREKMLKKLKSQNLQLFNDFRPFGVVFFKNEIQKLYNIRLLDQRMINTFQTGYWDIRVKDQKQINRLRLIFSIMIEVQATTFEYKGPPMEEILKTIEHVSFSYLIQLNLYQCNIVNIQPLSFIDAPHLRSLNLIYNYIYQYKSLSKANFKQLFRLFIYSRKEADMQKTMPFVNLSDSGRWNFSLQEFRLQKYYYNKVIMFDLSFLAKLKQPQISLDTFLSIHNGGRILQRKLCQKLYDESKIKLHLWETYDQREIPTQMYFNKMNFHAFYVRQNY